MHLVNGLVDENENGIPDEVISCCILTRDTLNSRLS